MKIKLVSVMVDDQKKALSFYTEKLGFKKKTEIDFGEALWLTLVSPEEPDGVELVLEPDSDPDAQTFKKAIFEKGIPWTAFYVDDIQKEFERLKQLGVVFKSEPKKGDSEISAIFNDTSGNFIQIYQLL